VLDGVVRKTAFGGHLQSIMSQSLQQQAVGWLL
jgi:hypothetical protein